MKKIYFILIIILLTHAQEQIISQINFAIANNNKDSFNALLNARADLNSCSREITPPLFNAIFFGNFEFTKLLLENGANVNLQDHCGTTPLHCAVRAVAGNKEQIIKLLLDNGADLKIKDSLGKTPSDYKPQLVRKFATVSLSKTE
jgi:ankyrin repeat protein